MLWDFLNRDVAFVGDLYSPMLSWLGACGMLLFVIWQAIKLKKEVITVQRAFKRVDTMVTALLEERRNDDHDRLAPSPMNAPPNKDAAKSATVRVDRDDLQTLDAGMEKEPAFRTLWAQYRRTLMLEHVPWFMEPRIFGTKRAAEVFTQDALLENHVNLGFYRHLPSLITGFGLLLTFLALLIGLGKLHAEGSEIVGIQGLINGLAGKFLTSIVGLSLAQIFLFIERPLISRLTSSHQKLLEHIDQLFSRKTVESMMEELLSLQRQHQNSGPAKSQAHSEYAENREVASLATPTAELTAAIRSLTKCQEDEQARTRQTVTGLPHLIREAVQDSLEDFTLSLQQLAQGLKTTGGGETSNLAQPATELTAAIRLLTKCQEDEQARTRQIVTDLPHLIRAAVQDALQDFTMSIHERMLVLKEVQPDSTPGEKAIEDRPLLWKTAAYPRDTSKDNLLDKIAAWPRRQEAPKHKRTG
ncbi:MAG: hypothetical protein AB7P17_11030 [Nitrospirales bacterium]